MASESEKFATALCCMDGRAVAAVKQYMLERYGIRYVDFITEPGMDRALIQCDKKEYEKLQDKTVRISVGHHGSRTVTVVGHDDCAGNPVSKEKHVEDIKAGVARVSQWNFSVAETITLIGLWAEEKNGEWKAEAVVHKEVSA